MWCGGGCSVRFWSLGPLCVCVSEGGCVPQAGARYWHAAAHDGEPPCLLLSEPRGLLPCRLARSRVAPIPGHFALRPNCRPALLQASRSLGGRRLCRLLPDDRGRRQACSCSRGRRCGCGRDLRRGRRQPIQRRGDGGRRRRNGRGRRGCGNGCGRGHGRHRASWRNRGAQRRRGTDAGRRGTERGRAHVRHRRLRRRAAPAWDAREAAAARR